jgi:hypothetical protein
VDRGFRYANQQQSVVRDVELLLLVQPAQTSASVGARAVTG